MGQIKNIKLIIVTDIKAYLPLIVSHRHLNNTNLQQQQNVKSCEVRT